MKKNKMEDELQQFDPSLMPKKILFGNLNKVNEAFTPTLYIYRCLTPSFLPSLQHLLTDRMKKLNAFLKNMTGITKVAQSPPFQSFLSKESDYEYLGYSLCLHENDHPSSST